MTERINLTDISISGECQNRERLNDERVEYFRDLFANETPPCPVKVVFDGQSYWLYDGFHRVKGADLANWREIHTEITKGTKADAIWLSCAANKEHDQGGLYRSNADKRRAVETALKAKPEMSNRAIAEHCGVSESLARSARDRCVLNAPATRTGKDGKSYPVPPPPPAPPPPGTSTPPPPPSRPQDEDPEIPPAPPPAPAPKPAVLRDGVGRRIPEELHGLWNRHAEARELLHTLSKTRARVERAQDERDVLFSEVNFSAVIADLKNARRQLAQAVPYAVCPCCQGEGCQTCMNKGLISKHRWDVTIPRELKDLAIGEAQEDAA